MGTATHHDTMDSPAPTRTVQLTSKRLKAHYLLGFVAAVVGAFIFWPSLSATAEATTSPGDGAVGGWLLFIGGLLWMVFTKVRMWWHHG